MATATQTKPVHTVRISGIKAAIWLNETAKGPRYNVTFARLYRLKEEERTDGDSGWRETTSFGRDDLLNLAKVADQAHSWIHEQNAAD